MAYGVREIIEQGSTSDLAPLSLKFIRTDGNFAYCPSTCGCTLQTGTIHYVLPSRRSLVRRYSAPPRDFMIFFTFQYSHCWRRLLLECEETSLAETAGGIPRKMVKRPSTRQPWTFWMRVVGSEVKSTRIPASEANKEVGSYSGGLQPLAFCRSAWYNKPSEDGDRERRPP